MALQLENLRHDANSCIRCSMCKFVDMVWTQSARFARQCPINVRYKFNLYSAPGLMACARAVLDSKLEFTPKLLDALYKCTLCGACDVRCKRNLDPEILSVIEALKARAVESGKGPLPEYMKIAKNIAKNNNRYGLPHEDRIKWITNDINLAKKADVLYFVGCAGSYTHHEIARSTAKILMHSKTDFMVSREESCCGHLLYATGQVDIFKKQAERNIDMVSRSGATTILLSCAEGYKTWKVDYPKILGKETASMPYKVIHITEHMEQEFKKGSLKFTKSIPLKITYHDPCNLGRLSEPWLIWEGTYGRYGVTNPPKTFRRDGHAGVYEPPRAILRSIPGVELLEMPRSRDNAWCCGAGAGVDATFGEFALWTASERLDEVVSIGAEAIVTACPACESIFHKAVQSSGMNLKVYDITEFINEALS